ncbi:hypothetical protein [Ascidiimonas sp. W6]|uniref:hypothetical protein n=1 Tax=Ascidiimonas meishanensis TaxID=3128903 RepID=UPI0030EF7287
MPSSSYKTKHFLFQAAKLLLVIACLYFLYEQISRSKSLSSLNLKKFFFEEVFSVNLIVILILFSLANWSLEFSKWKALITPIQPISYQQSARQSLSAFVLSAFTPNKIGEYGVRPLFFEKSYRKKIAMLTAIHHFTQMLATLIFGLLGFLFLFINFPKLYQYSHPLILLATLFIIIGGFVYFNTKKQWISIPYFTKAIMFICNLNKRAYAKNFSFSLARYLIFSHQFLFLLYQFNLSIPYTEGMAAIATVYLLSSILPVISFFDILIKGSVAVFVFGFFDSSDIIILKIIGLMWIFNYLIPIIIGIITVIQLRYPIHKEAWKIS